MIPSPWEDAPAWPRIARTITMLHIGSALLILMGLGLWALWSRIPPDQRWEGDNLVLTFAFAAFLVYTLISVVAEAIVVHGLRRRRPWAWTAGIVVLAMDAGSILFAPITIIGLINLLHPEVRAAFAGPPPSDPRDEMPKRGDLRP